jgi:SAM-dependent methyltransferase
VNRPFAEAAEQNKSVIFDAIRRYLKGEALEIGSGTGQHAVHFASRVPGIVWQTSDLEPNLAGIEAWIEGSGLQNMPPPLALDVNAGWPDHRYDIIYTANTLHIMDATSVERCLEGVGQCLKPAGVFAVYGPFNYAGRHTSESNARFDQMLRARGVGSGIRDFDWIEKLADTAGLDLLEDVEMPVNNRTLIWQKRTL